MRILAGADLHGVLGVYEWLVATAKSQCPDVVVLAGDLLGVPDGFDDIASAQAHDRHRVLEHLARIDQPVMYVMGNDDWIDLEPDSSRQRSIHGRRVNYGSSNFVGYQYTLPFMGGVNERSEEQMREDLRSLERDVDGETILVTHGPAYGILDRGILDRPAGSRALSELTSRRAFRVHVHGHIHREFGRHGRHFNVASGGQKRAMIIDVSELSHEVLQESGE